MKLLALERTDFDRWLSERPATELFTMACDACPLAVFAGGQVDFDGRFMLHVWSGGKLPRWAHDFAQAFDAEWLAANGDLSAARTLEILHEVP